LDPLNTNNNLLFKLALLANIAPDPAHRHNPGMISLIDIGANLTHNSFDPDRSEVLDRAQAVGVERFIVTGTSVAESIRALELAREHPTKLFATAGIHPHHAKDFNKRSTEALRKLAAYDEIVAIGECGLDFYRNFSPLEQQKKTFSAQLELAADVGLPVFLHQRAAHDDFIGLLQPIRNHLRGGVAHCFTGGLEELQAYLNLDLYIGITGWLCDERRGTELLKTVSQIPLDRILIETDSPYLLPRDLPTKPHNRRNEPRFLPHILERLAAAMNRPLEIVAEATCVNAERLFRLKS